MGRRGRRLGAWLALLGVAALCAGVAGAAWVRRELERPWAGWSGASVDVVLDAGLDARAVLERLEQAGVVRSPRLVAAWLVWSGGADRLRAGEYRFERPASALEVLDRLERGDVLLHPVTVQEGLSRAEIARRLAATGFGDPEQLAGAFDDPGLIRDLDALAQDLEGYLFPDTYRFTRGESPARIAEAMVRRFREQVGESFAEQASRVGLTVRGAVTLASMIEKETSLAAERARISRVFHNRLQRGMKLECDPTVMYALARAGQAVSRLTFSQLRFESPWNTYVVEGLPPGPIGSPGLASLRAAVRPADGEELFFVAAPEGGHRFSATYDDHQRAVVEWRTYLASSR